MNHPHELLAGCVDGSLAPQERAAVDAHLATCEACRREVELARGARAAIRSLEDPPVPAGLADLALSEAAGTPSSVSARAGGPPRWYRAAGLAAAAAVVGVLALSAPGLLGSSRDSAGVSASAESARSPAPLSGNLTPDDLRRLALGEQLDVPTAPVAASAGGAQTDGSAFEGADRPARCLQTAYPPIGRDLLLRIYQGEFQGRDAFIGVYESGPGAGQPADTRTVLAAAADDCAFLSKSSARI